ncbi:MAG: hypothetical protein MI922_17595, partial [Bacteroidales bacterium]|nr:hypothetical protein [Bacteroidales bacterium]
MEKVIAVFDIGKTNKKVFLFNKNLDIVFQEEKPFKTIMDDDGFECDDIVKIEKWIKDAVELFSRSTMYEVKAVNITTYGATVAYLDIEGNRLTPIYNYLKPMPEGVTEQFYEIYGGVNEFSRITASPALGMLNSGLQALWLKKTKPEVFSKVKTILHFPQYISYLLTGRKVSEYTSIGCHTAIWDYDNRQYHPWVKDENMPFPNPVSNSMSEKVRVNNTEMDIYVGIHDSSASIAPYILGSDEKFVLVSTGTWCINMNPFNYSPLTPDELSRDCLSYMSINQLPVKSSRLFMGYIHDKNVEKLVAFFKVANDAYKKVGWDEEIVSTLLQKNQGKRVFFVNGVPGDYIDNVDLSQFTSFEEAYHQLMMDITELNIESLNL